MDYVYGWMHTDVDRISSGYVEVYRYVSCHLLFVSDHV